MNKKRCLIAALALTGALAVPAVASAHVITSSSLSCNQLDFSYAYFSIGREPVTLTWSVGTQVIKTQTVQTNGPSSNITVSPPDLSPYQGDTVTVTGTWTFDGGGSFTDSAIAYCSSPHAPPTPNSAVARRVPPGRKVPPVRRVRKALPDRPGRVVLAGLQLRQSGRARASMSSRRHRTAHRRAVGTVAGRGDTATGD